MGFMAKMIAIAKKFGGGSSASTPVVILPETELTQSDSSGKRFALLDNLIETIPTAGKTYKVVWDGVEYTSPAVDATATIDEGETCFLLGNYAIMTGSTIDGWENADESAPYCLMIFPNGIAVDEGEEPIYVTMIVADTPTSPTLSIVEAAAEETASAGGGVFIVHATTTDMTSVTVEETPDEAMAAAQAGQHVACHLAMQADVSVTYILPLLVFGDMGLGASATYGTYAGGTSIEINDGYNSNGDRVTAIYVTESE